ncbi:MAG: helix-turn-helix domain-containing protein [Oscillospiraceae bacterium]|nr:helix-turn-helix domain-containing protein [Oscillospiraceae bacterium]
MSNHPFWILGQNIKQERISQNMTQEQLSEKVGISAVFLSQIENSRKVPSLETVYKIASCLGVTIEKIFKGDYTITPNIDQRIEVLLKGKSEKEKQDLFDIMNYIAQRQSTVSPSEE